MDARDRVEAEPCVADTARQQGCVIGRSGLGLNSNWEVFGSQTAESKIGIQEYIHILFAILNSNYFRSMLVSHRYKMGPPATI